MRRTILICDDSEAMRLLVRATVEPDEYVLLEAADGRKALAQIDTHSPHLVILDLRMPEMGGLEVLARLAERTTARPRVIVLTAENLDADGKAEILRLADTVIGKPFRPSVLLSHVRRLLDS